MMHTAPNAEASSARRPWTARSERGAIAAEFALLIPAFLLLIFGMVQLGLTYQRQEAVHAAAREGARIASLPSSTTATSCARAGNTLTGTNFTGTPNCTVVGDCSAGSTSVVVTIDVDNEIEIPFFGNRTVTLTGRGEFRCE